jgi:DNA-binding LytR/AlgR family response regulator
MRTLTARSLVCLDATRQSHLISLAEINLIEAHQKQTRVYFKDGSVRAPFTLQYLQTRLPPHLFFRVHRTQIVNVAFVQSAAPLPNGTLQLILREYTAGPVVLSRRRAALFIQQYSL